MQRISFVTIALTLWQLASSAAFAAGVWTPMTNSNPTGTTGAMVLLCDGTVLFTSSTGIIGESFSWARLHPDSHGNYVNGTWSIAASSNIARLYAPMRVLPTGKVMLMGGEYSSDGGFSNSGEIYDPVANTWTTIAPFPQSQFGDDPVVLLDTGKLLCGYLLSELTYLYDPVANSWSQTGSKLRQDASDEETWILLPDGSVLSYDVFASPATGAGTAQRYVPSQRKWITTGPVPVPLTGSAFGFELGPMILLPDGRAFLVGANNNTVLYTPSSNTWTQGPSLPANLGCDDAPACILPNGHVLFIADNSAPFIFTPPSHLFDFDPVANTITDVTPTGALGAIFANQSAFQFVLMMLPNGHAVLSTCGGTVWDYTPTGSPSPAWEPKILSVTKSTNTTYIMKGTQLNGLNEGSCYGDDIANSTNYPIVRLTTETGKVEYCKATNWSPGLVATGGLQTTVDFALPSGTLNGVYQLAVIANGIASPNQQFVIGPPTTPSNVTAVYNSGTKTLTLTGDDNPNSLTVTLQAGVLTVEGANGTKINSSPSFQTKHSGQLVLIATMNGGDDAMSVIGISSSTTNISMGAGNDTTAFTLCNVANLTADGGAGVNLFIATSSTFAKSTITNFAK